MKTIKGMVSCIGLTVAAFVGTLFFCVSLDARAEGIRKIFVVLSSHIDTGYAHPMDEMEQWCKTIIDDAITQCKKHESFRWTIEDMWQLDNWLKRTDDTGRKEELFKLIREGRIEVGASWAAHTPSFFGMEDVNRNFYYAKEIERKYNIKIKSVVLNDMPGFTWALPQAMAGSGIKYFLTGINPLGDYWGSGTSIPVKDLPFWWLGPDKSKVLTWVDFSGYMAGLWHQGKGMWGFDAPTYDEMKKMVATQAKRGYGKLITLPSEAELIKGATLDKAGLVEEEYNRDAILVMHSSDLFTPTQAVQAVQNIDKWNAEGNVPQVIIATPRMFFEYMEEKSPVGFSSYSGDWTGSWNTTKQSTYPAGTAAARWARDHFTVAEELWGLNSILFGDKYPGEEFSDAYKLFLTWIENCETINNPYKHPKEVTERDLRLRNDLVVGFHSEVGKLLNSGFERFCSQIDSKNHSIVVVNPLSWERTDLVRVNMDSSLLNKDFSLIDIKKKTPVTYQKDIEGSAILFLAEGVPSLGYKKYEVALGSNTAKTAAPVEGEKNILENQFYKLTVDEATGWLKSIVDKATGKELVSAAGAYQFNQFTAAAYPAGSAPLPLPKVTVEVETGPVQGKIVVKKEGYPVPSSEYILYSGLKRIDVANYVKRRELRDQNAYYVIDCPFNLDIERLKVRTEMEHHFMLCSGENHLPGASKWIFYNQHTIDLNEGGKYDILIAPKQTYVNGFVGNSLEHSRQWSPTESTWLMILAGGKKAYETRDAGVIEPDWEPGLPELSPYEYSITSDKGDFDSVKGYQFGWGVNVPLLAKAIGLQKGTLKEPAFSFFRLNKPNVAIVTLKRPEAGGTESYIIRLQEFSGKEATLKLETPFKVTKPSQANIAEDALTPLADLTRLSISPYQTVTLKLNMTSQDKK